MRILYLGLLVQRDVELPVQRLFVLLGAHQQLILVRGPIHLMLLVRVGRLLLVRRDVELPFQRLFLLNGAHLQLVGDHLQLERLRSGPVHLVFLVRVGRLLLVRRDVELP